MAKSYTIKCAKCGVEFVTPVPQTKFCRECAKANHNDYNRAYRAANKGKTKAKAKRDYEFSTYVPPVRESFTMAQIRKRNRRVHVEAGWRGQRVAGGGSNHRLTLVEVAQ